MRYWKFLTAVLLAVVLLGASAPAMAGNVVLNPEVCAWFEAFSCVNEASYGYSASTCSCTWTLDSVSFTLYDLPPVCSLTQCDCLQTMIAKRPVPCWTGGGGGGCPDPDLPICHEEPWRSECIKETARVDTGTMDHLLGHMIVEGAEFEMDPSPAEAATSPIIIFHGHGPFDSYALIYTDGPGNVNDRPALGLASTKPPVYTGDIVLPLFKRAYQPKRFWLSHAKGKHVPEPVRDFFTLPGHDGHTFAMELADGTFVGIGFAVHLEKWFIDGDTYAERYGGGVPNHVTDLSRPVSLYLATPNVWTGEEWTTNPDAVLAAIGEHFAGQ